MSNLKSPSTQSTRKKKSSFHTNVTGSVSAVIGSGRPAQESIVWLTIKWSFSLGILVTILFFLSFWFNGTEDQHMPMEEIKSVWGIFVPIITLALGYIFGRSE